MGSVLFRREQTNAQATREVLKFGHFNAQTDSRRRPATGTAVKVAVEGVASNRIVPAPAGSDAIASASGLCRPPAVYPVRLAFWRKQLVGCRARCLRRGLGSADRDADPGHAADPQDAEVTSRFSPILFPDDTGRRSAARLQMKEPQVRAALSRASTRSRQTFGARTAPRSAAMATASRRSRAAPAGNSRRASDDSSGVRRCR